MKLFTKQITIHRSRAEAEAILKSANARICDCHFHNGEFMIFCPRRTGRALHTVKVTGNIQQNGTGLTISLQAHPSPVFSLLVLLFSSGATVSLLSLVISPTGLAVKIGMAIAAVILVLVFIGEYNSVLDLLADKLLSETSIND